MQKRLAALIICAAMLIAFALPGSAQEEQARTTAILNNFISPDPLNGDNGLPTSPSIDPTKYGPINIMLDVDGNANEATITCDVSYFEGKYYMYSGSFAYGGFDIAPGAMQTPTLQTNPKSFYRAGPMVIYESEDLMNWRLVSSFYPTDSETSRIYIVKKPRVVYSEKTGLYTMWFRNGQGGPYWGTWIMQSKTPYGPWDEPRLPENPLDPTHANLLRDFDIGIGPDGEAWMVKSHGNIELFLLNDEMTGVIEHYETGADTSILNGGIGIHYENGWWYITGDHGGGNPIASNFTYIMAKDPRGPWISPIDDSTELPVTPAVLADDADAGYAQANGSSTVLDMDGNYVTFIPFKHYISSPSGAPEANLFRQPGDANMALGGQWFYPLSYDADGKILPMSVTPSSEFPLAKEVVTSVPDPYQAAMTISNTQSVVQTWTEDADSIVASVCPSVFQRTPDAGPSRAAQQAPQEPDVNAPLIATLSLPGGESLTWELDARTIRWSPHLVSLNLPEPVVGGGEFTLTLSTEADNGGYGVAVGPILKNGTYAHVAKDGAKTVFPDAGMMIRTFDVAGEAPVINVAPKDVTVVLDEEIGFSVDAKGIGLGYQWFKNGEIILAPDGYNESDNMIFRRDFVTKEDAGEYYVSVFNTAGEVVSDTVKLYVLDVTSEAVKDETSGTAVITCKAQNNENYPVDIVMTTEWGSQEFAQVESGATVEAVFTTDAATLIIGDVKLSVTAELDGESRTAIHDVHYGLPLYYEE